MTQKTPIAVATLALALAFALSPLFTAPFSGFTEDQLPIAQIRPPVQPAGYAFAIWGVIYTWLVVSAVFGLWARRENLAWHSARLPLCVSLMIGVPWLAIAGKSAIWALITIMLMALFAIASLIRAPRQDRWLFQAPTALYAGWLTAASAVSVATVLAGYGLGPDQVGWAYGAITCGLIAAALVYRARPSAPEYLGAVIWALVGIVVANWGVHVGIAALAGIGIAVLLGLIAMMRTKPL